MRSRDGLDFKLASTPEELEQIRALSYETFVEEIPQHPVRGDRLHKDRFEDENTYLIGLDQGRLVAMLALRGRRPFSLDQKLEDLDSYLPDHRSPCELRLFSVRPEYRHRRVAARLMDLTQRVFEQRGYDLALISGTTRQTRLYRHLGFEAFGPLVGTPEAHFQPMYLTYDRFKEVMEDFFGEVFPELFRDPVNLLPGPVKIEPWVQEAYSARPISHRSSEFKALLRATKGILCEMTGAQGVEIATGSGTLANDMIGAQLASVGGDGLVLSNGEFGDRLIDHALRFGLPHKAVKFSWGETLDFRAVERALEKLADPRWLWCVHGETSTGVLNDLPTLKKICRDRGVVFALDAVSTIGALPVDLRGVWLASGCSGKALGAFPGLALVFFDQPRTNGSAPRSLDLRKFSASGGIPFTLSSNQVNALRAAVERLDVEDREQEATAVSGWLRNQLDRLGLRVLAAPEVAHPAVTTIPLPERLPSPTVGRELANRGFLVSFESGYLIDRNWIQVCLMRRSSVSLLEPFLQVLEEIVQGSS
jgi:aspartate aminotransferase-like enzyme/ribosomal protein S18 acetylase RimI-like enzyme